MNAKVIAITNQKGGVGKTTTSINLSACLAEENKKTLIIDIDPQGNSTSGLGIDRQDLDESTYDILINDSGMDEAIMNTGITKLDIIPSNIELTGAEVELVSVMSREYRLKKKIDQIRDRYDYIILDCPPSLGLLTLNALAAADSLIVPIQCEYFALEGLGLLMNTVNLVKDNLNTELYVEGVLLTMVDTRTRLSIQVITEVRRYFEDKVFKTVVPRNIKLAESPSHGIAIIDYDSASSGAKAYRDLAKELIQRTSNGGN